MIQQKEKQNTKWFIDLYLPFNINFEFKIDCLAILIAIMRQMHSYGLQIKEKNLKNANIATLNDCKKLI